MFLRVRYDNQGRMLTLAPLNSLVDDLTVLWVSARENLMLFVDAGKRALLQQSLEKLPLVRLDKVNDLDLEGRFGPSIPVTLTEAPLRMGYMLALDLGTGAVEMSWRDGEMHCQIFAPQERIEAALGNWPMIEVVPRWRRWVGRNGGFKTLPQSVGLPDAAEHPTMASRNVVMPKTAPDLIDDGGLFIAHQEADGHPVFVRPPFRAAWIGSTQMVPSAVQGIINQWLDLPGGSVIVCDQHGVSQHKGADLVVSWQHPGQAQRINPLSTSGVRDVDEYAELIFLWLSTLGINRQVIGSPTYRLLNVVFKIAAHNSLTLEDESKSLSPLVVAALLEEPKAIEDFQSMPPLGPEDQAVWRTRNWMTAKANLLPASAIMKRHLDQPQINVLWCPPFDEITPDLRHVSIVASSSAKAARAFMASTWLPLRRLLSPSTLVVGIGVGAMGERTLEDVVDAGASVLLWGRDVKGTCGGTKALQGLDLFVSRTSDAEQMSEFVGGLPYQNLLAQADYQVTSRIGGRVRALTLLGERKVDEEKIGDFWPQSSLDTVSVSDLPAPLLIFGGAEALKVFEALAAHSQSRGESLLVVSGNGQTPDVPGVTRREIPGLNPLRTRSLNRWLWWSANAGLSRQLVTQAWENGVAGLGGLAEIAQGQDAERLDDLLGSGHFGHGAENPLSTDQGSVSYSSADPAVTTTLIADALEAGRRAFLWRPQVQPLPAAVAKRLRAVVYSLEKPIDGLPWLIVGGGDVSGVPDQYLEQARSLRTGEALLVTEDKGVNRVRLVLNE